MNQKICDFCGEIIQTKLYYITVTEVSLSPEDTKLLQFITLEESFEMMNYKREEVRKGTRYYEVDEGCKKTFDYLLTLRKDHMIDLRNQVLGIFKLPYTEEKKEDKDAPG